MLHTAIPHGILLNTDSPDNPLLTCRTAMANRSGLLTTAPACTSNPFDPPSSLKCRIAKTQFELEGAYAIVHDAYVRKGLMPPHPSGMRVSVFNALPNAATFVGWHSESIVATITLVADSPLGLPMDDIYKRELDSLRNAGRNVAEIGSFATQRPFPDRIAVFPMLRPLSPLARSAGIDDICIAVHPRHVPFYQGLLLFEALGGLKSCGRVRGAPAVALRLDLQSLEERARRASRQAFFSAVFGRAEAHSQVRSHGFPHRPLIPFEVWWDLFIVKTDVLRRASKAAIEFLKTWYPVYDFRTLPAYT